MKVAPRMSIEFPIVMGRKRNIDLNTEIGSWARAEYFLVKELIIVEVVMSSIVFECMIFWKIPESWSA